MKKTIAAILAITMAMTTLAGCGQTKGAASSGRETAASAEVKSEGDKEKVYKIGAITLGAADTPENKAMLKANDTISEAAGIEIIYTQLGGYDDESLMTAYESLINQGVDALELLTLSENTLPLLKDLCEKNNVKFLVANRKMSDEMRKIMFASPMFVGNEHADEVENAYAMVKELKEKYYIKNMAAIGLVQGDINGGYRDAGIAKACEEFGINLLTTTRGIVTTEDVTKSVEGLIASYPEMDSIFIVGGVVTNGALAGANQALVKHGLDKKIVIAMVDIAEGMKEYMDDGPLKLVAGGNLMCDYIFGAILIANNLRGTPLSAEPARPLPELSHSLSLEPSHSLPPEP